MSPAASWLLIAAVFLLAPFLGFLAFRRADRVLDRMTGRAESLRAVPKNSRYPVSHVHVVSGRRETA